MALRNITNKVLKAWFEMLDGVISVPVYRTDVDSYVAGNYVILRVESETSKLNNNSFVTSPVIITEVVTRFNKVIDDGVAADIDDEIAQLLYQGGAGSHNLPAQQGIQIVEVKRQEATYLPEDDGIYKYHRLITRNVCRVVQTDESAEVPSIGTFVVS